MTDGRTSEEMLREFRASMAPIDAPPEDPPTVAPPSIVAPPQPPAGPRDPFVPPSPADPYDPVDAPATGDDRHVDWPEAEKERGSWLFSGGGTRALIGVAVLAAVGIASLFNNSTPVDDLAPGHCFNDPGAVSVIENVETVDCAEPHDFEVFANPRYPDGPFPGDEALFSWADVRCEAAFTAYVGVPLEQSELWFTEMVPTADSWSQGDRTVNCILVQSTNGADIVPTVGSLAGSGR